MKKAAWQIVPILLLAVISGSPAEADSWKRQRQAERGPEAEESGNYRAPPAQDERKRYREDKRYRSPKSGDERSRPREGRGRWSSKEPREAESWWESGRSPRAKSGDRGVSLDSAVDRIRSQTGARILSTDTIEREGRRLHEIKILTEDGRVRRMQVDGDSGEVLGRPTRRSYR